MLRAPFTIVRNRTGTHSGFSSQRCKLHSTTLNRFQNTPGKCNVKNPQARIAPPSRPPPSNTGAIAKTVGVVSGGIGGVVGYAAYDEHFRSTLEKNVPFSYKIFKYILPKKQSSIDSKVLNKELIEEEPSKLSLPSISDIAIESKDDESIPSEIAAASLEILPDTIDESLQPSEHQEISVVDIENVVINEEEIVPAVLEVVESSASDVITESTEEIIETAPVSDEAISESSPEIDEILIIDAVIPPPKEDIEIVEEALMPDVESLDSVTSDISISSSEIVNVIVAEVNDASEVVTDEPSVAEVAETLELISDSQSVTEVLETLEVVNDLQTVAELTEIPEILSDLQAVAEVAETPDVVTEELFVAEVVESPEEIKAKYAEESINAAAVMTSLDAKIKEEGEINKHLVGLSVGMVALAILVALKFQPGG